MKSVIHLWQEEAVAADDFVASSVTIEYSNGTRTSLWYRVSEQHKSLLTQSGDPFVIATLMLAMSQSSDLIVHGTVSPSLLTNLAEFQAAWSVWRSQYQIIQISAETEREQQNLTTGAISAFSGGVDSCFTAFRHRTGRCGRWQRNLQAGLMVHGFDIPFQDPAFDSAAERSRVMLDSLGMELIPMITNFRDVINLDWEDVFGTAIASCLHLLKGGYNNGLIPSSYFYGAISLPYGSNPVSDRFLSSSDLEIIHDGAIATRLAKIKELLNWPEALQNLRVCWQGSQKDRNCGRCEKCVRNILNFRILGSSLPPCFERDITDEQILNLKIRGVQLDVMAELLNAIEAANISGSWVNALKICVRRNRMIAALEGYLPLYWKKQLRQLKSQLTASSKT